MRQGYVSAVVIATQAMLSLGLTSFSRDVVISLAQQGYLAEAGEAALLSHRSASPAQQGGGVFTLASLGAPGRLPGFGLKFSGTPAGVSFCRQGMHRGSEAGCHSHRATAVVAPADSAPATAGVLGVCHGRGPCGFLDRGKCRGLGCLGRCGRDGGAHGASHRCRSVRCGQCTALSCWARLVAGLLVSAC